VRQAELRLRAGGAWDVDLELVFANEIGRPLHPANMTIRSFRPLLERAGVPRIRFHDLRHTCATILLARGVPAKMVSEMLGHASVAITLDIYSHVTPTMHLAAAATWADVLVGTRAQAR
jgi:integrase